jgi:hypothetical protein
VGTRSMAVDLPNQCSSVLLQYKSAAEDGICNATPSKAEARRNEDDSSTEAGLVQIASAFYVFIIQNFSLASQ